ncbi:hypothetical protein CIB84_003363 [Bambusicola thoracicus]|uniref:Uroplakin-1b n=1 Tax=Bambusicola thoracicus TaxID=9083 RepID=A0A2P4T947_BAMTH|nr:hypothetical protein CIB84_003363 [Bambusicola thoracicus]
MCDMPWNKSSFLVGEVSLHEGLKMAKTDNGIRICQGLLILGNVVIGMCGIALTAECIFFVSDPHGLYPLLEATENDDIYAAAWIGIFVGFALLALSILGIVGVMKSNKTLLLVYIILMLITYAFEMASCITAATHRDFLTPNLFLKQMLERYMKSDTDNNSDKWMTEGVTKTWDNLMLQNHCCGVRGPLDWQEYTSAFRMTHNDADYPWPRNCCVMDTRNEPINLDGCKLGVPGFYNSNERIVPLYSLLEVDELVAEQQKLKACVDSCMVALQGCYDAISGPLNRQAWGVAWFGFAILCWTVSTYYLFLFPPLFPNYSTPTWVEVDDRAEKHLKMIFINHQCACSLLH